MTTVDMGHLGLATIPSRYMVEFVGRVFRHIYISLLFAGVKNPFDFYHATPGRSYHTFSRAARTMDTIFHVPGCQWP